MFEFLIPQRPVSSQTKSRKNLQRRKNYVRNTATQNWSAPLLMADELELVLVYLCEEDPADIDNIIKPIQDAVVGLIYDDDFQVVDVEAHRRRITGAHDLTRLPSPPINGIVSGKECVYVRLSSTKSLEDYL